MQEFGFSGAREARERTRRSWAAAYSSAAVLWCNRVAKQYALSGRQPIFLHAFHGATEPAKQYAVAGLGISRSAERGNGPHARRAQKGRDTYGFHPSFESPRFPLFLSRRTERLRRSYLCSGPEKERQYRYQLVGRKAPFLFRLRSSR